MKTKKMPSFQSHNHLVSLLKEFSSGAIRWTSSSNWGAKEFAFQRAHLGVGLHRQAAFVHKPRHSTVLNIDSWVAMVEGHPTPLAWSRAQLYQGTFPLVLLTLTVDQGLVSESDHADLLPGLFSALLLVFDASRLRVVMTDACARLTQPVDQSLSCSIPFQHHPGAVVLPLTWPGCSWVDITLRDLIACEWFALPPDFTHADHLSYLGRRRSRITSGSRNGLSKRS